MEDRVKDTATSNIERIAGLSAIAAGYRLLVCDVWGVLHNGVAPYAGAIRALTQFRAGGGHVVMVTNAPRRRKSVFAQLAAMGVPDNAYDTVVTSGDVTRTLIAAGPRKVYHIGPERDLNLFEGLDRELVDAQEAEVIVCSGLVDDTVETPADYTEAFGRLQARGLDFICANPDLVVERGDSLIYCAGALAAEYARLGGRNRIAGKPYRPIYELAIGEAENLSGGTIDRSQILAIGDGMPTDIKGAADFGIDALYISAGIHAAEYGPADQPDHEALNAFLAARGASPVAYMPRLDW